MKIYRIYTEETEYIPTEYDEDGYCDDRCDSYETHQTTIKYVDNYEKVGIYFTNYTDIFVEEIEVE